MRNTETGFTRGLMAACLLPLAAVAAADKPVILGNSGGGESFFIQPPSPRENDDIVIVYPQRSCGEERIAAETKGNEITITVNYNGTCLYSIQTPSQTTTVSPGGLYRQYRIGRLPVGNYRVRLSYRDLSEGSSSRSFSTSESFAVLPAR